MLRSRSVIAALFGVSGHLHQCFLQYLLHGMHRYKANGDRKSTRLNSSHRL